MPKEQEHESAEGSRGEKKRVIKEPAVSSKFNKILLVLQSDLLAVTLALQSPLLKARPRFSAQSGPWPAQPPHFTPSVN